MSRASTTAHVVVIRDDQTLARHPLDRSPIRIGRHPDSHIVLDDPAVAETQALLVQTDAGWRIRSVDPAAQLIVNNEPTELHVPTDGDEIGLGPFVLRFELSGETTADADSAPPLDDRTRVLAGGNWLEVPDIEPEAPPVDVPGYTIDVELGRGGMGRVYRALQQSTHRTVALKVMLEGPGNSDKAKRRFEREVRIVASLRHPNIAQIYDSGVHQGRYWFAMEYVDGLPMDAGSTATRLTLREKLELMRKVCHAVGHAHDRGVIHRDLKPSNILVGDDGEPHILDFGLAKAQESDPEQGMIISLSGELMGTPAYMSPEQTESDASRIDARTDVYSLGVILFQLVTGEFPYNVRGRLDEVIREIATTDPTRPTTIRKDVDAETEAIILKAIAKRPEDRYATAGEMAEDLRRLLAGEPISARLDTRSYVLGKTVRKNRPWLVAAAVLVAAVMLTALVTTFLLTRDGGGAVPAKTTTRPEQTPGETASLPPTETASLKREDTAESPPQPAPPAVSDDTQGSAQPPAATQASAATPEPDAPISAIKREPASSDAAPDTATNERASASEATTQTAKADADATGQRDAPASEPTAATPTTAPRLSPGDWLDRLEALLEEGDLLRARMALDHLGHDQADDPRVARARDRLDTIAAPRATDLGAAVMHDRPTHVLRSPPPTTADWQAAMQLAEQMVAADQSGWVILIRVMVEDDRLTRRIHLSGRHLAFHGGRSPTPRTQCDHGDLVFVGSAESDRGVPTLSIAADGHARATILLKPVAGSVTKLGDVVLRRAATNDPATTRSSNDKRLDNAGDEARSAAPPPDPDAEASTGPRPEKNGEPAETAKTAAGDPVELVDDFIRWFESQYTEHMLVVDGKDTDVKESIDAIGLDKTIDRYAAIRRVVLDYARRHPDRKEFPDSDLRKLAAKQYELVVANVRGSGEWIKYEAKATREGIIDSYAQGAKAWIPFYQRLLAAAREGAYRDVRELIRKTLSRDEYQALIDANDRGSEVFYAALKKGIPWYAVWKPWVTSALDKSLAKDKEICRATVERIYGPNDGG